MKTQVFNPYLPLNEYVPDVEPRVFDGRVYIYGSHDEAGGTVYCPGNYVGWSAPVDDLSDWQYHGEIYKRTQDPSNSEDKLQLWAPDVVQGPDGRYFLYYCFSFHPEIGVAVSNSPSGPFEFYGHIHYPDGQILSDLCPFDPAVLVDDNNRIFLYYGFAALPNPDYPHVPLSPGCLVVELETDMITVKVEPKICAPGQLHAAGTSFENHAFYEAASIRKIYSTYYLIYSSQNSHELCYATSNFPDHDFIYRGTIISNGDIGLNGRKDAIYVTGNNHGSIVKINGQWYIFYHRQTHATESSRQGCAEKIIILPDGSIPQVEITSCGLNDGALKGIGEYSAAYACHLACKEEFGIIVFGQDRKQHQPYIYQEDDHIHYIANVNDGTVLGWKYFEFNKLNQLSLVIRGIAEGRFEVFNEEPADGTSSISEANITIRSNTTWTEISFALNSKLSGNHPIYIRYNGNGKLDIQSIIFC